MNKQQPLLQINNLSLAYGAKEILKAVHLTVCPGEILGIVGSSGGGKSTLLKTLTGLLPANAVITGGEILWQGHSLLSGGRLNSSSSIRPPACSLPCRCLPGSIFLSLRPF